MLSSQMSYVVYFHFLSFSAALVLDTFKDVSLGGCTCTFTMVLDDDGIIDDKNSACNRKCTRKSIEATLGGPASVSNIYRIHMQVARGSVKVVKLTATLVGPAQATMSQKNLLYHLLHHLLDRLLHQDLSSTQKVANSVINL